MSLSAGALGTFLVLCAGLLLSAGALRPHHAAGLCGAVFALLAVADAAQGARMAAVIWGALSGVLLYAWRRPDRPPRGAGRRPPSGPAPGP